MKEIDQEEDVEKFIVSAVEACRKLDKIGRLSEIGRFSKESRDNYLELYREFIYINGQTAKKELSPSELTRKKGQALENLASFLLEHSGRLFRISRNIRTNSNEIDQFCEMTTTGQVLINNGLINSRFASFIGECKNYNVKVGVTYIGKFYSLMQTTASRLGILFSSEGITGTGWKDGTGLVKKLYLCKEKTEERYFIIDFNKRDFDAIAQGSNFLEIVDSKMSSIKLDVDYSAYITKHPVEELLASENQSE